MKANLCLFVVCCAAVINLTNAAVLSWGPSAVIEALQGGKTRNTAYQTVQGRDVLLGLLQAAEAHASGGKQTLLLLLEDEQVTVEQLPFSSGAQTLSKLMEAAPAQLALPNAVTEGKSLAQYLPQESTASVTVAPTCVSSEDAAQQAMQQHNEAKLLVLQLCGAAKGDSNPVALLSAVASSKGRDVVALYTTAAQPAEASVRRTLQVVEGDVQEYTCDDKCWAQVRALEAFILAIIVMMAIGGGTWLMSAVDTPTRFAAPKKEHSAMD